MSVILRPLPLRGTPEWKAVVQQLIELASSDDHPVMFPTHIIEKDGKITGYMSIFATPIVNVWFDSKSLSVFDTVRAIDQAEAVMRNAGAGEYIVACAETSPVLQIMEKRGYTTVFDTTLFRKVL